MHTKSPKQRKPLPPVRDLLVMWLSDVQSITKDQRYIGIANDVDRDWRGPDFGWCRIYLSRMYPVFWSRPSRPRKRISPQIPNFSLIILWSCCSWRVWWWLLDRVRLLDFSWGHRNGEGLQHSLEDWHWSSWNTHLSESWSRCSALSISLGITKIWRNSCLTCISDFFPVLVSFLRKLPVVGDFLNMPGVAQVNMRPNFIDLTTHL